MKLCFSTIGCPDWSWTDIVATAHDLGYDGFEVRGIGKELYAPSIPQFQTDQIQATQQQLRQLNLSIPCLTSDSVLHLEAYRERTLRHLDQYMSLAQKLGIPYIRVLADNPVPAPGAPVDEALVIDMAKTLAPKAAEYNVMLLIETNGWFADTSRLAGVMSAIDHPNIGVLWDIHHPYRYAHETPETTWERIGTWIKHVHVKDSIMQNGKVRYVMLGYGDVPVEACIQVARKHDYEGYYSLEWVRRWDLSLEEPGIAFTQYVGYMRSL